MGDTWNYSADKFATYVVRADSSEEYADTAREKSISATTRSASGA